MPATTGVRPAALRTKAPIYRIGSRPRHTTRRSWSSSRPAIAGLQRGRERVEVTLDNNGPALLMGAGVWGEQIYVEQHSVLLVLASDPYDASSYFLQAEPAP